MIPEVQKPDIEKTKEILKITKKIIERYKVFDINLATSTAITLYEKGIHLDKFKKKYYEGKFDLDEIVRYVLILKEREQKIIKFPERKTINLETIYNTKQDNEIIYPERKVIPIMIYQQTPKKTSNKVIKF